LLAVLPRLLDCQLSIHFAIVRDIQRNALSIFEMGILVEFLLQRLSSLLLFTGT
tara:strand:- start:229 stop:390 length:162 start_codon:yes stop_codon:yes gene_type:complete